MYPGPNHMRDRHGNNPDLRPDQRMSLNSNLEPRQDGGRDIYREKEREKARAQREKAAFSRPTVVQPDIPSPAMFTMVKRQQPDNPIARILGPFSNFLVNDQALGFIGVDQPVTPAPVTNNQNDSLKLRSSENRQVCRPPNIHAVEHPTNNSSSVAYRAPALPPTFSLNDEYVATAVPKPPQYMDNKWKVCRIFTEMDSLRNPVNVLPRTPPAREIELEKSIENQISSTQTLSDFHCDLSDDSDLDSTSSVLNESVHSNSKVRQSTSQNSDDSSNSEDSSCSDSDDSSSNSSSEEEETSVPPESSEMTTSPVSGDTTAMSWSLESIFKPQNRNPAKEDSLRKQEVMNKPPYDGQYDSLSRSPHRTDLAPPIITKEPVGRNSIFSDSFSGYSLDSSMSTYTKNDYTDRVATKFSNSGPKSFLSESELELECVPVTKHKIQSVSHKSKESPYNERSTKDSKSLSLPVKPYSESISSREKCNKNSHSIKEKDSKNRFLSRERIPSNFDTDSDESNDGEKGSQKDKTWNETTRKSSRKAEDTFNSGKYSRDAKLTEMSLPVRQESKYATLTKTSPSDLSDQRHSNKTSEAIERGNPSKSQSRKNRHLVDEKSVVERKSRKSAHEDKSSNPLRSISPAYCPSANLRLKVPKLSVCYGEDPCAVLLIPLEFVKPVPSDNVSPVKDKVSKEVMEMRTSPSNEDSTKLRALSSIYKGSKKRPNSQELDRTRKSPKTEESQQIKQDTMTEVKKERASSRTNILQPETTHRHSSSRHRRTSKLSESDLKEKEKHHYHTENRKRKRKMSQDMEVPKKQDINRDIDSKLWNRREHKSHSEKKESYRSYVKNSSSPAPSLSSRVKESSRHSLCNTSHNVDIQEFASVERNSDDDSCFRTPQQVQGPGCKEINSKRTKLEDRQGSLRVISPTANCSQNPLEAFQSTSSVKVPKKPNYFSFLEKPIPNVAIDHMPYLLRAKELKHLADNERNRLLQVMIYIEAGLYFILTGESMEQQDTNNETFSMYNDTLIYIRHVSSIIARKESSKEETLHTNIHSKLAVLSLRCQGLLYLRLYKMHEKEVTAIRGDLVEYFKATSKSLTVPISWNPAGQVVASGASNSSSTSNGGRIANSPSSLSPTPSPAGSVGSEGSQSSSGYGTEGASQRALAGAMSGTPPMVPTTAGLLVPKNTLINFQRHLSITHFLAAAHVHWNESDSNILESTKDFFIAMDRELGPLTLHSTPSELVIYVQKSLDMIRGSLLQM